MRLSEQVAALEAESEQRKGEIEKLRAQVHRQEGAIKEGRAQNQDLIKRLAKATELAASLTSYFHGAHGMAEHLEKKRNELAALDGHPTVIDAPRKPSLIERLWEKPHADAPVDHPGQDTGRLRTSNGQPG